IKKMKSAGIKIILFVVWVSLSFFSMRYIGAQWEREGALTTGLLVGVSFVSKLHILYSIATVFASMAMATSVVVFLTTTFRRNKSSLQRVGFVASVIALAGFSVAFYWNRKQIAQDKLPAIYRYYDSTGRLLEPEKVKNLRDVNIILISIDTLNPKYLGVYGNERDTSPTIDSLANEGALFLKAFSHSPKTSPSHMSLFTSLYPSVHKIRNWNKIEGGYSLDHHLITLPEILSNVGYNTAAFTGGGNVQSSIGFGDGFEIYDNEDQLWENAFTWLDQNHQSKFFLFLHTFKVHSPYLPPAPYNNMFGPKYNGKIVDSEEGLWTHFKANYKDGAAFPGSHHLFWDRVDKDDPRDVERLVALYQGGIRFMSDRLIGTLMNRMKQYGLSKNTLIVFTSDHGEEFLEHGDFLHKELYDEHLQVPLIIKFPEREDLRGKIVEKQVSHVDLVPTILEYLSLPVPILAQGTSLFPTLEGTGLDLPVFGERIVISDVPDKKKAIRTLDWKYIWWPTKKKKELFHLVEDPGELRNVFEQFPEMTAQLHRQIEDWMQENQERGKKTQTTSNTLSKDTIEKLRALGYIK
ncbi:sulfatase-like hydrolase/transferase, partial [bacterium]|nr:sulfatase-like hydrolase/transferase [bacterium]